MRHLQIEPIAGQADTTARRSFDSAAANPPIVVGTLVPLGLLERSDAGVCYQL